MSNDYTTVAEYPLRHHKYYFDFIIFEVEKVLFKVPRRPFEVESELFKDMFTLPPGSGKLAEGSNDYEPFTLHNATVKEFEALLKGLLPDPICGTRNTLSMTEWIYVLCLSHKWTFDRLFKLAVQKLENFNMDPVTRITIAEAYSITNWLRPAYFKLVTCKEPLTLEEARKLDLDTVVKLNMACDFHYKWIIEDGKAEHPRIKSPQLSVSDLPYYKSNVKKKTKGVVRTQVGWGGVCQGSWGTMEVRLHDEDTETLNEKETASLEAAINSVLTELFGLK